MYLAYPLCLNEIIVPCFKSKLLFFKEASIGAVKTTPFGLQLFELGMPNKKKREVRRDTFHISIYHQPPLMLCGLQHPYISATLVKHSPIMINNRYS